MNSKLSSNADAIAQAISEAKQQGCSTTIIIIQINSAEPPPSYESLYPSQVENNVIPEPILYLDDRREEDFIHQDVPPNYLHQSESNLIQEDLILQKPTTNPVINPNIAEASSSESHEEQTAKKHRTNYLNCIKKISSDLWTHFREISPTNAKKKFFDWKHSDPQHVEKHRHIPFVRH